MHGRLELMSKRKLVTEEQRTVADAQIKALQRQINYDTKDYTVELVIQKFEKMIFSFLIIKEVLFGERKINPLLLSLSY